MAEVNQKQHLKKAFAAAAKLSVARAQLAEAESEADEAETELRRLTGGTSADIQTYNRFFECEGDPDIRLSHGIVVNPLEPRCPNFVSIWGHDQNLTTRRKLCAECSTAHDAAARGAKAPASTSPDGSKEIPF